jgi:glycogen operon protein
MDALDPTAQDDLTIDIAPGAPRLEAGSPQPLGANWTGRGTNFVVFSAHADRVELCLFDASGREEVARLDLPSRTGNLWHGFLPARFGGPGLQYGYRVHGPYDPARGLRFNPSKLLIDPCAQSLRGPFEWHSALHGAVRGRDDLPSPADSAPHVPRAEVVDGSFDWAKVRSPNVPWRDTIVYEVHVKGFTQRHPAVPPSLRGKFLGLAEPVVIEHLKRLGVTTIELMPVQAFVSEQFLAERGLSNYWGYNSLAWFAPEPSYAVEDAVTEFKTMVRALHEAGLEVILDVVFNHTAEGNEHGPTLSLRGFDNPVYYRLPTDNRSHYKNYSGCGNTINFDEPAVRAMVIDCLRYWATDMRVDGFRFDLAPILGRDANGFSRAAPFFSALRADPQLAYLKMIAEPWDVGAGGYQLGSFPVGWAEWNDRYRDTVRAFWRGDRPLVGEFVERFAGSSDLFRARGRKPTASVNYVAAHDGFTLHDTVSYSDRHNEANREGNRDGHVHNLSANYGIEGPTDDPVILATRARQARNLLATVFLSQGVPMLMAGQRDQLDRLVARGAQRCVGRVRAPPDRPAQIAALVASRHVPQGHAARRRHQRRDVAAPVRARDDRLRLERFQSCFDRGAAERCRGAQHPQWRPARRLQRRRHACADDVTDRTRRLDLGRAVRHQSRTATARHGQSRGGNAARAAAAKHGAAGIAARLIKSTRLRRPLT